MPNKKDDQQQENGIAAVEPTRFGLDRLRQSCRSLFGVTTSTFDGAAYELAEKDYTVDEMAEHIKEWQGRPVRPSEKIKKEEI
ncbi:MAG: hypothetical protein RR365_13280 [Bacteroides sp.]